MAERLIRRATGSGPLPADAPGTRTVSRHVRCETIVVGAGIAGLTAALEAADDGEHVLLCDEFPIGSRLPPGPTLHAVRALETRARATPAIEILERHAALGLFDGPTVPSRLRTSSCRCAPTASWSRPGPPSPELFPGNDLPGVWLGRAASAMAALHGVAVGRRVVVVASTTEGVEHLRALVAAGARVVAALVPAAFVDEVPHQAEAIVDGD